MGTSKSRIITAHLLLLSYLIGLFSAPYVKSGYDIYFEKPVSKTTTPAFLKESDPDIWLFKEAMRTIKNNYYGYESIPSSDLTAGMIKGMVQSLKDKHSTYFDVEETKKFNEVISGDFEGIGAVVDKNDFWVMVKQILAGSPAKAAGILSGDVITKANSEKLEDLTLTEAIEKIRWPANTTVELEVYRVWEPKALIKKVVRWKITVPSVDGKMLEGTKTAHIVVSMFWEKTSFEFLKTYSELEKQGADSLILDLRDNGGGLLETSVNLLSNFIERDKLLVTTKERDAFMNRSYFSYGPGDLSKMPFVLLVNENSASASEIAAGALKDYKKTIIVGTRTYGKGSVQQPFVLSDGSELKITVAKWYTPLDHGIDKIGIEPDVEVPFEKEDFEKKFDRQLDVAKQIVSKLKKSDRETVLSEFKKISEDKREASKKSQLENGDKKTSK